MTFDVSVSYQLALFCELARETLDLSLRLLDTDATGAKRGRNSNHDGKEANRYIKEIRFHAGKLRLRTSFMIRLFLAARPRAEFRSVSRFALEQFESSLQALESSSSIEEASERVTAARRTICMLDAFVGDLLGEGRVVHELARELVDLVPNGKGPPISASSASRVFRFLHITDLHMGMREQDHVLPHFQDVLFEDLKWFRTQYGPVEAVFFTGDVAYSGKRAEFARAEIFLQRLLEAVGRDAQDLPRLFVVPGNHDLTRPPAKEREAVEHLRDWHRSHPTRKHFEANANGSRATARKAFGNFASWQKKCPYIRREECYSSSFMAGDFTATFESNGMRIGVMGLNSAFLQLSELDYEGRIAVIPKQWNEVCRAGDCLDLPSWCANCDFAFLLTHHPTNWFGEESKRQFSTELHVPGRFLLHLCGHRHEPSIGLESERGAEVVFSHQGRSLFGMESVDEDGSHDRTHGYVGGEVELRDSAVAFRLIPRMRNVRPNHEITCDNIGYALERGTQHTRWYTLSRRNPARC